MIGDIDDFADEGKLAAYFGIVPRVQNSNETERSGRITKRGTKLGRTTLVQCALVAKRYSPYLARYYEKIKSRRGGGKAIIALARKFLGIIYRTLKNNWVFEDFPKFVLAEAISMKPSRQPPFPSLPCSRTVLAVQGALRKIFSKPEKIFLRRAQTARPGPLRAVPKTFQ